MFQSFSANAASCIDYTLKDWIYIQIHVLLEIYNK